MLPKRRSSYNEVFFFGHVLFWVPILPLPPREGVRVYLTNERRRRHATFNTKKGGFVGSVCLPNFSSDRLAGWGGRSRQTNTIRLVTWGLLVLIGSASPQSLVDTNRASYYQLCTNETIRVCSCSCWLLLLLLVAGAGTGGGRRCATCATWVTWVSSSIQTFMPLPQCRQPSIHSLLSSPKVLWNLGRSLLFLKNETKKKEKKEG